MKSYARSERVSRHIRNTLAALLRKKIRDPRLRAVTITGVDLSPDLRLAKVYFSAPGDEQTVAAAEAGFRQAHAFIKRQLAANLGLRYMPEIRFCYDRSLDYGARIDNILKSLGGENEAADIPSDE
jgi:ribosome-binding factor A